MSTKAKIGKDWVKCQVVLQETGETLHVTFAPGQAKKKITVHIDGRTDTGFISLVPLERAAPPYDAALVMDLNGAGVKITQPVAVAEAKPVAPPKPVTAVVASPPKAEPVVPPVEESVVSVVQEPASDTSSVSGGRRGRKPTTAVSE